MSYFFFLKELVEGTSYYILDILTCVCVRKTLSSKISSQHVLSGPDFETHYFDRSRNHWYESSGLTCHLNTVSLNTHELSCGHMKHTTIHRPNRFVGLLHGSMELYFYTLCITWRTWLYSKHECLWTRLWLHVILTHSTLTPGCPTLCTTTHSLFHLLLPTCHTVGKVLRRNSKITSLLKSSTQLVVRCGVLQYCLYSLVLSWLIP